MALEFTDHAVRLVDLVSVEEAETLLEWLQAHPQGEVDLGACQHLHTANLQVLLAAHAKISAWPPDETLAMLLTHALTEKNHA